MEVKRGKEQPKVTCSICGKTIIKDSRGSLTSWLFRSPECRCEYPGTRTIDQSLSGQPSRPVESYVQEPGSEGLLASLAPPAAPGDLIDGRYKILQQVGAGGMGTVYRAFDEATNTTYALKLIAPHLAEQKIVAKRFEQEARAAKALTHPNIVAVYEVGRTNTNVPYLIMDYIEGQTLADRLKSDLFLDSSQAINIFVQVAEALSYAHKHGVIHRDLKPSNIMLTRTADGVDMVKIADFGIAKVIEPAGVEATKLTQTGELLGSPSYMSPEQCRGDVTDARSDVYSVGCMMYEALSGQTPFEGENPVRIILKHISEEPPPLKNKVASVSSELQSVVMRCLAKDPEDRYASAEELRADLERTRDGKKPLAHRKRGRRRLKAKDVIAAATIALAIPVVIFGGASLWIRYSFPPVSTAQVAQSVTDPAESWNTFDISGQEDLNNGEYGAAEQRFQSAANVASTFEKPDRLVLTLEKQAVLFHVLGKSSEEKQIDVKLAKLKPRSPASKKAPKLASEEQSVVEKLWDVLPDVSSPREKKQFINLSQQINELGSKYIEEKEYERAAPLMEKVLAKEVKLLGENDLLVAKTLDTLAVISLHNKDYARGEVLSRRALEIKGRQLPPSDPAIAKSAHTLAEILSAQGKYSAAASLFEQEIEIYEKHPDAFLEDIAHSYSRLASMAHEQSQYERAIKLYKQGLEVYQKAGKPDKAATLLEQLCDLYYETRQKPEAEAAIAQSLAYARKTYGQDDVAVAGYLSALGELYHTKEPRDFSKAINLYKEALAIRQHKLLPESDEVLHTLRLLMYAYAATGNNQLAEPLARQYLAIWERQYGRGSEKLVDPLTRLANICWRQGKRHDAQELFQQIEPMLFDKPRAALDQVDHAFYELAQTFFTKDDYARLEKSLRESLTLAEKEYGPNHPQVAQWLDDVGHLQFELGRYPEALQWSEKAVAVVRQNPQMDREQASVIVHNQAYILRTMGRGNEAAKSQAEADRIRFGSDKYQSE